MISGQEKNQAFGIVTHTHTHTEQENRSKMESHMLIPISLKQDLTLLEFWLSQKYNLKPVSEELSDQPG